MGFDRSDGTLGPCRLADYVDPYASGEVCWEIPASLLRQYASAIDVIDPDDPHAIAACFTSAYGTSPVRAGSYLRDPTSGKVRRFAPRELARLMGFRSGFWWPESIDWRAQYRLLGNSLSVPVVKRLLSTMM
jgi:site-specific DNA-cytosine methylase